jgi:hypothetical protein
VFRSIDCFPFDVIFAHGAPLAVMSAAWKWVLSTAEKVGMPLAKSPATGERGTVDDHGERTEGRAVAVFAEPRLPPPGVSAFFVAYRVFSWDSSTSQTKMPMIKRLFVKMSGAAALATLMSGCRDLSTDPPAPAARTPLKPAAGPGTFAATGQLSTPRAQHTATLLANGKVLIAGGVQSAAQNPGATLATAELYDPATGSFSATGSMTAARRSQSATLLLDGRVLIAGGFDGSSALSSTELYDPSTGTFSAAGNMIAARYGHDAILLDNGTVLFVGGSAANLDAAPAEIYDPTTGIFTPTGPYIGSGACDFCAPSVLLSNGLVLFTGQNPAQLYDPRSSAFSATGSSGVVNESAATLLMNGTVLFAGGEAFGRSSAAELYDPRLGAFVSTGSMAWRRVWHTLTLLPDGTVLAAGGETDSCATNVCSFAGSVASAELYDPTTGAFTTTGSMTAARETHTATVLNNGRVLVAGGSSYGGIGVFYGSSAAADLYTPPVIVTAPTLLTVSGDSSAGAIVHAATGQLVTADHPAVAGELLQIPCTNLNDGSIIRPRVIIGGVPAELLSSTSANDSTGITRLTVRMPALVASGSVVRVVLRYIGRTSNPVMLAAQQLAPPEG